MTLNLTIMIKLSEIKKPFEKVKHLLAFEQKRAVENTDDYYWKDFVVLSFFISSLTKEALARQGLEPRLSPAFRSTVGGCCNDNPKLLELQ